MVSACKICSVAGVGATLVFSHIFRLSPGFSGVENRDSETPLPFSHTVGDQICQKAHGDSLFPFVTLTHYRNLCRVKQCVMDALVMY